ncbi:Uncharacterized protein Adt_27351 [Abeliophyllum distichum]|uniref:Uncharacterized protein n=1 Tax=Abeliophyllum distichum TaxID=126358 RepID=A0ABD1RVI4_9LAMI
MSDDVSISQKPTDIINLSTLKGMKIVKEPRKWVAKTKEFDTESGPSTLPLERDEAMEVDGQDEKDAPFRSPPHDIPRSSITSTSFSFNFSEDYYNLLNAWIDSYTFTVDDLQYSLDGLSSLLQQVLVSQQTLHSRFDTVFPSLPPLEY